jgi:uncharacterized membrane protein (DUF485 family)
MSGGNAVKLKRALLIAVGVVVAAIVLLYLYLFLTARPAG